MVAGDVRQRARHELEQLGLSVESASYLVDDRPPGGWDSLLTQDQLRVETSVLRAETSEIHAEMSEIRAEMSELRAEIRAEMSELRVELHREIREQTRWFATVVIGAMSVSVAASAVFGAALRFT